MRRTAGVLIVLIVGGGCVVLVRALATSAQTVAQPIAFNHAVHISDAGLTCLDCHTNATKGVYAGLPGKQICLDCHDIDGEQGEHPEKDKLFTYVDLDEDIRWVRVAMSNPDVFFSHRRHVASGALNCLVCHEDQASLDRPPARARLVMKMADCIECHHENGASSDCLACHR